MPTPRKPTAPTAEALDQFWASLDALFARREERQAFRHYLIGRLLPREHNKTVVELAALAPGANRQQLHHFMRDAPWDAEAVNRQRLKLWQAHPYLGPHSAGVLILEETSDSKRGPLKAGLSMQHLWRTARTHRHAPRSTYSEALQQKESDWIQPHSTLVESQANPRL